MDLGEFDSLILSPGIPLNRHPLAARARAANLEIIGDIELFARARPELPPHKVVGITGTNGKSTTTALVHHILQTAGVPSLMGGNIGLPILGVDPLPEGGVYVLELSSYQIDLTKHLDCDVVVITNITPDHLERYSTYEEYADAKLRLARIQSLYDLRRPSHKRWCVVSASSKMLRDRFGGLEGRLGQFVTWVDTDAYPEDQSKWPNLQGPHNMENAVLARTACEGLDIDYRLIERGLRTYSGLPHRMERIRDKDGVLFINDSKATNATATAPALAAFPAIRWILGGQAKSDTLDECLAHFSHVRSAYTIGEAGGVFASLLRPHLPVAECGTLENAVTAAAHDAQPGDTVLLSPACASFDQFADFEARGDAFRDLVGAL